MKQDFRISHLDVAILLYHVHTGARLADQVGFEDSERTLKQLTEELAPKRTTVHPSSLESALWSCNLMDETGEWWSPTGESFDEFLKRILRYASPTERLEFDKRYNFLKREKLDV